MNFKEILDITRNLIDEVDIDEQIDIIIKSAINQSYRDLGKLDSRVTSTVIPIINKLLTLPTNFVKYVDSTPKLTQEDRKIGNSFITDKTGVVTMIYEYAREYLENDSDEIDLSDNLLYALALYGAGAYFSHRKKKDMAEYFMNQYNDIKFNYETTVTGIEEGTMFYEEGVVVYGK